MLWKALRKTFPSSRSALCWFSFSADCSEWEPTLKALVLRKCVICVSDAYWVPRSPASHKATITVAFKHPVGGRCENPFCMPCTPRGWPLLLTWSPLSSLALAAHQLETVYWAGQWHARSQELFLKSEYTPLLGDVLTPDASDIATASQQIC